MSLRWLLIPTIGLACCFAEQVKKPACDKQHQGMAWPEQDARSACTEIEVCTVGVWKYRWQPVTVHVSQLAKDPKLRGTCKSTEVRGSPDGDTSPLPEAKTERPASRP
jgi:hypothetical protein